MLSEMLSSGRLDDNPDFASTFPAIKDSKLPENADPMLLGYETEQT